MRKRWIPGSLSSPLPLAESLGTRLKPTWHILRAPQGTIIRNAVIPPKPTPHPPNTHTHTHTFALVSTRYVASTKPQSLVLFVQCSHPRLTLVALALCHPASKKVFMELPFFPPGALLHAQSFAMTWHSILFFTSGANYRRGLS